MTDEAATGVGQTADSVTGEQQLSLETKYYTDGTSATGVDPLPDLSPEQQEVAAQNTAAATAFTDVQPQTAETATYPQGKAQRGDLVGSGTAGSVGVKPPETRPCPLTLEAYLRSELVDCPTVEFVVVAMRTLAGDVKFYIRPANRDGLTRDFEVMGETVRNATRLFA